METGRAAGRGPISNRRQGRHTMADGTTIQAAAIGPARLSRARPGSMQRFMQRRSTIAFIMALPLIVLIAGLVIYPAIYALDLAMLNKRMTQFVGLNNFTYLLKRNTFQLVIFQSCLFAVTSVVLKAFLGFIIAHLMHNIPGRNQRIWRGLLLVPWVIPLSLSTLSWWWMFDPSYSAFNWILNQFGFANVPWLGVPWTARFCTIAVNVWYGTPFFMIMYLAALKSVPEQLYEAAAIDGATGVQKLFFVTLPMMRNIIAITVLFSLIVTFADFDIVRILTSGGPQDMTHVFATYAFSVGIQSGDIPLGASVSLFMLPILGVGAYVVLRGVMRRTREVAA
jgi:multiple sugar transport system permease protein